MIVITENGKEPKAHFSFVLSTAQTYGSKEHQSYVLMQIYQTVLSVEHWV